jgi:hypothetical protein
MKLNEPKTRSKYALKKARMKAGTYSGTSPFFSNIPEFQHHLPLESYPHLRPFRVSERREQPQLLTA